MPAASDGGGAEPAFGMGTPCGLRPVRLTKTGFTRRLQQQGWQQLVDTVALQAGA